MASEFNAQKWWSHLMATLILMVSLVSWGKINAQAAFESYTIASGTSGSSRTVSTPAGTVENDFLLTVIVNEKGTDYTISPPSGWKLLGNQNQSTSWGMSAYYKVASASEPTTYTWGFSTGAKHIVTCSRFSGVDPQRPINGSIGNKASSGNPTAPAITTSVDNATVVFISGNKKDILFTGTNPSRTQRYNEKAADLTTFLATFTQASAGSTGTTNNTGSSGDAWSAIHFVLNSAPASDPNTLVFFENSTFTVPANVYSIDVECWGGGGAGGGRTSNGGAGGGGGGAYASKTLEVEPGQVYNIIVGSGGAASTGNGGNGSSSQFNSTGDPVVSLVLADGGSGGSGGSASTAGAGGTIASSIGDIRRSGGNGGTGSSSVSGGGGSSAGVNSNGNNASAQTPGFAPFGGGSGAPGSGNNDNRTPGLEGYAPGGGGSGAMRNSSPNPQGGPGANGMVIIQLPPCVASSITLSSGEGTDTQAICLGAGIDDIEYTVGGSATGATVTGLPEGLLSSFSDNTFSISGTPTETGIFEYTVTATGCSEATVSGTITISSNPEADIVNNSETTELTCLQTSISVTATGGSTYSWSEGLGSGDTKSITSAGIYTVTVADSNGCTDTAEITITGTTDDTEAPSITCPDDQEVEGGANCDAAILDYTASAIVSDNCVSSTSIVVTQTSLKNVLQGLNDFTSVTFTASDGVNTASCTFTVTLIDNEAPTPICKDVTIALDAEGNGTVSASMVDNGSNDNCGSVSLSLDNTTFTCGNKGPNQVILTVVDQSSNSSTCSATITVEEEGFINVITGSSQPIPNGSSTYTASNLTLMGAAVVDGFIVRNYRLFLSSPCNGNENTILTGASITNTEYFSVTGLTSGSYSTGFLDFSIVYNGGNEVTEQTAVFTVSSTIGDYSFGVKAVTILPEAIPAVAQVKGNNVVISNGDLSPNISDHTNFGVLLSPGTLSRTFTITNVAEEGAEVLSVSDITISGANTANFTVDFEECELEAGESCTFTVLFDSDGATGVFSGIVLIENSDAARNPYEFSILATVNAPLISVRGSNTLISNGDDSPSSSDNTLFGNALLNQTITKSFIIKNLGTGQLSFGAEAVSLSEAQNGGGSSQFEVLTQPSGPLSMNQETSFSIRFTSPGQGSFYALVTLTSSAGEFTFVIQGNGPSPRMQVTGRSIDIPTGTTTVSTATDTDYGTRSLNTNLDRTFTIRNPSALGAQAPLQFTGTPRVEINGSGAAMFSVSAQPSTASIGVNGNVAFRVRYRPTAVGCHWAEVSIANNDSDRNPYTFVVRGNTAGQSCSSSYEGLALPGNEMFFEIGDSDEITDLSVYPNPSTHQIWIQSPERINSYRLEIFNIDGKMIRHFETFGGIELHDISSLVPGVYILRSNDPQMSVFRFVKI